MGIRDKSWARRSGNYFFIPRSRIRIGPWGNARSEFENETVAQRANSLILRGQTHTVKGLLSEDGEWFELIDGEIRWRAWDYAKKELGVDLDETLGGMRCELQTGFNNSRPTKKDILKIQLSYGTNSEPLTEYDKARNAKKLHDEGESISDLAGILHCSESKVRYLISLDAVPEKAKKNLKPSTALAYSKADEETRREIDGKIDRGEPVKGKDITQRIRKPKAPVLNERNLQNPTGERLSDEEVQKQIKEADRLLFKAKSEKERMAWQYFIRAMRITLGYEEKI